MSLPGIAWRGIIRRVPFTMVMLVVIAAVGLTTATHLDRLQPSLLRRFGFAPFHLHTGDLVRLLTSAFLTLGGWSFYGSLAMIAVCVGLAEKRVGTWRTGLTFWGIHLATLLIQSLLLAISARHLDVLWVKLVQIEHDVGPSAGYYGCLGLVCQKQSEPRRRWLLAIIGGILLSRLIWSALSPHRHNSLAADIAHLIAFPLGVALAKRLRG
jgi:membrane associated rhomboid family serine protease